MSGVDDYIAAAEPTRRERMMAVRALVRQIAPGASEGIEWKMPIFRRGDKWVGMANQKSYLSIYLGCAPLAEQVVATDPRLKGGKACVNIGDKVSLPLAALGPAIAQALGINA